MSRRIMVHDHDGREIYPIWIEADYRQLLSALSVYSFAQRRVCIVSDANVAPLYMQEIKDIFTQAGCAAVIEFIIPAGEASKNLDMVSQLYETLILAHFDRNDVLVALGGGVIGDLTGYAAATYLRGIRFIQLPTTLLAQVDSSVGGKTGVDFNRYKNMVGAFYMPILVYMNTGALRSMQERDYLSGMAEVVKYGLIMDRDFYGYIQSHINEIHQRSLPELEYITYECCDMKRRVVEEDAKEQGVRALLNMGHTIGHAVEKLMEFELLHGECVSIGCVASAQISYRRGMVSEQELTQLIHVFSELKLPVRIPSSLSADGIIAATKSDKKMNRNTIRFVLMKQIGCAYVDETLKDEDIRAAIQSCMQQ